LMRTVDADRKLSDGGVVSVRGVQHAQRLLADDLHSLRGRIMHTRGSETNG